MPLWPRGGLWRDRDFLKLWSAQTISQVGSQITQLALPLVAIVSLDAPAFHVALLPFFGMVPFLLLALPVGVWIDRLRRKPVMVVTDVVRAVALLVIPAAHLTGTLSIELLYAAAFLNGAMAAFFDLAYLSYVPSLVERERLADANAKLEGSRAGAQIAGPGAAGGLVALVGAPLAVLVDALSFGVAAALVARIRRPEPAPAPTAGGTGMRAQLREGLSYVIRHPHLRVLTLCTGTWNLFISITFGIYLVYVVRELGVSAGVVGVIFMLGNVGTVAGVFLAGRIGRRLGIGRTIAITALGGSAAGLAVPLAPESSPVPVLVAGQLVFGFAMVVFNVTQLTFRQTITPTHLLGRMNSVVRFLYWSTSPAGFLLGGVIAEAWGLRSAIWIGTVGALVAFVPILFSSLVRLRELPDEAHADREEAPEPVTLVPVADA
ncbi:MAG TPA: MFS transporter [Gaiellaceae bacterium]|nr:MFS transporter [Gaiellaceae bacterium]